MTTSIRLLSGLSHLNNLNKFYGNKYLIMEQIFDNTKYNYLSWVSRCLFKSYYDDYSYNRKIFALDFSITNDILKINHLSINNDYNDKNNIYNDKNKVKLTEEEVINVKKYVFNLIKNKAIENNINKIAIDIHSDLKRYNYELNNEGFIPNYDIKCYNNPNWIQAEKIIN